MVFTCHRCNKDFKTRWNLKRHFGRKNPCKVVDKINCLPKSLNCLPKSPKSLPKSINCLPIDNDLDIQDSGVIDGKKIYICMYCSKLYKNRNSKYKHQINCKNIQNNEKKVKNIKEIVKKLRNTDKSLIIDNNKLKIKKTSNVRDDDILLNRISENFINRKIVNITNNNNNIINSNNTNNTTNNNNITININPFGKENLDSLSLKTIKKIFSKKYGCLNSALSEIYAKIPENNNFHLANKGSMKYMKLYDGNACVYEKTNKFKTRLSDKTMDHLETLLEKNKDKIIKNHRDVIEKVIDEYFSGKLTERYDEEVELFILNHTDEMKQVLTNTLERLKSCK